MNDKNVSVKNIQEGIDYLQDQFMKPLVLVGETLIDEYRILNQSLVNQDIDRLIQEQQQKLDRLKNDLNAICEKAKTQMGESSEVVSHEQAGIDNTLSEM